MKIVGIIPARYNSSRFPGKPLLSLKGKSMIQRVYEGAKKSKNLSDLIVATDDKRIFDEVVRFGGNVQMTSKKHNTGTDRCGEVSSKVDADIIINIQGDEPLIDYRQLDQLCDVFNDEQVSIATLAIRCGSDEEKRNSNRVKIVLDKNSNALYFSRSFIPNVINAEKSILDKYDFYRHIGVYAYRRDTLLDLIKLEKTLLEQIESLEQLRWLYNGYEIRIVKTTIETQNIDVPEDVENVLKDL